VRRVPSPEKDQGRVVLVRHGQTDWSRSGQHTGRTDLPLNDEGRQQAAELRPLLASLGIDEVWSSPLQRAATTAELAGLTVDRTDPQLQEWDYGGYDGLTSAQIRERVGSDWTIWTGGVVPGDTPGETLEAVRARCDDVVARVRPVLEAGRTVALVAHGHLLRVLATSWLGLDPTAGSVLTLLPASVSTLVFEHDRPALGSWNASPRGLA
jgi:broad specificity phosphatase PhoE